MGNSINVNYTDGLEIAREKLAQFGYNPDFATEQFGLPEGEELFINYPDCWGVKIRLEEVGFFTSMEEIYRNVEERIADGKLPVAAGNIELLHTFILSYEALDEVTKKRCLARYNMLEMIYYRVLSLNSDESVTHLKDAQQAFERSQEYCKQTLDLATMVELIRHAVNLRIVEGNYYEATSMALCSWGMALGMSREDIDWFIKGVINSFISTGKEVSQPMDSLNGWYNLAKFMFLYLDWKETFIPKPTFKTTK